MKRSLNKMGKEIVMTKEGYEKLQEKYDHLVKVRRLEVAEQLKAARELGDLSENAEYDAAKDEQAAIEGEIKKIEDGLHSVRIIDDNPGKKNTVNLGSTVKLYDLKWDEELVYTIVGSTEADINNNKISNESAIAKGILGRKKGDTCDITAPNGDIFQVLIKEVK